MSHPWPPRGIAAARDCARDLERQVDLAPFVRIDAVPRTWPLDAAPWQVADAVANALGFRTIGRSAWHVLERQAAVALATDLLMHDLAYDGPLMDEDAAARLVARLCATPDPYAGRFVASGTVAPGMKQWTPIGEDTFELVLVGFDTEFAFLLRACAED